MAEYFRIRMFLICDLFLINRGLDIFYFRTSLKLARRLIDARISSSPDIKVNLIVKYASVGRDVDKEEIFTQSFSVVKR